MRTPRGQATLQDEIDRIREELITDIAADPMNDRVQEREALWIEWTELTNKRDGVT